MSFCFNDNSTGDFGTGVSGGLCGEIIRLGVNDDGTADDILQSKTSVKESAPGITGIAEERQKVAFVIRMWLHGGVIMIAGLCKVIGAVALLVDVHGVKSGRIWHIFVWEAKDFRLNENSAIRSIVKFHEAAQIGSGCAASDPGGCLRAVVFKERKKS